MEIKITINGLDQLTEALALIGSALAYQRGMIKTSAGAVDLMLEVTDKIEDYTDEEKIKKEVVEKVVSEVVQASETEEEKKVVAEGPPITIEDVRAAFMAKNSNVNKPKLKKILTDFGVKKVTDLKEKDFQAVLVALRDI